MTRDEVKLALWTKVKKALGVLSDRHGYETTFNKYGCHECASDELRRRFTEEGKSRSVVYVTTQDHNDTGTQLIEDERRRAHMDVRFAYINGNDSEYVSVGELTMKALQDAGLETDWTGSPSECIQARITG